MIKVKKKYLNFIILCIHVFWNFSNYSSTKPIYLQNQSTQKEFSISSSPIIISWSHTNTEDHLKDFFQEIITSLEKGNQITTVPNKTTNKKSLLQDLEDEGIQFHLTFETQNEKIIWKLYNTFEKKFINGKSYQYKATQKHIIQRTILIDIWHELFGEETTPYQCFLVFLNTSPNKKNVYLSTINFVHPLLPYFNKELLKTKHNILDLTIINSQPLQSILFIMQKNTYIELIKLNSFGQLQTIGRTKSTAMSPTANEAGLFFIDSQSLYRYYFNKIKNKYMKEKIDTHQDYVSVLAVWGEEKLLTSRKKIIYEINYETNHTTNEITIKSAKKITEAEIPSLNMTYEPNEKFVVVSQKINSFYQLVIYDKNNRKIILTHSPYHKQDPSMSPCGNYIAYIAQNAIGERRIEILNRYSGEVIIVTPESSEYRFPMWIIR